MEFSEQLMFTLCREGASLAGIADLSAVPGSAYPRGIALAVPLPAGIVHGIQDHPTPEYLAAYHSLNDRLNALALRCADILQRKGYRAVAQTTSAVTEYGVYRTAMPHKTVATRAGLGWIGKCALLVTPRYGSAVRITSVLTDAPLTADAPVTASRCGSCSRCTDACPAHAVSGKLWTPSLDRDAFFDPLLCRAEARRRAAQHLQREITLCGKCIVVCPYTQAYLDRAEYLASIEPHKTGTLPPYET